MDILYIPYLQGEDSLELAMNRMKATESRAVIVYLETNVLFLSREIVRSFKDKIRRCSQLNKELGFPVVDLLQEQDKWILPNNKNSQFILQDAIENYLDSKQRDYGLLFLSRNGPQLNTVTLVTRHEHLKEIIQNSPVICICTGPGEHLLENHPEVNGEQCWECTYNYTCY